MLRHNTYEISWDFLSDFDSGSPTELFLHRTPKSGILTRDSKWYNFL